MKDFFEIASEWSDVGVEKAKTGHWESASGPGSTNLVASDTVELIKSTIEERGVKSILDLGCGDWNWMQNLKPLFEGVTYEGWDAGQQIVSSNTEKYSTANISFHRKDIISEEYPKVDLIVCRDVLFHLPISDGLKVIENVKSSGAKYLISTSFIDMEENVIEKTVINGVDGFNFYRINLLAEPFNLEDNTILAVEEGVVTRGCKRYICLFEL